MLNDFEERQVDGMTYEHILTDDEMKKRLECIRRNIPAYQYMNSRQKKHYFCKMADNYNKEVKAHNSNADDAVKSRMRVKFNKKAVCKCNEL